MECFTLGACVTPVFSLAAPVHVSVLERTPVMMRSPAGVNGYCCVLPYTAIAWHALTKALHVMCTPMSVFYVGVPGPRDSCLPRTAARTSHAASSLDYVYSRVSPSDDALCFPHMQVHKRATDNFRFIVGEVAEPTANGKPSTAYTNLYGYGVWC